MQKTLAFVSLTFLAASTFAADTLIPAKAPSDPEIAEMVLVVNEGEIDAGKLAKKKSDNKDVKDFAEMMISEHKSVSDQTKALAKKLDMKPKESPTSETKEKEHEMTEKRLKKFKGAEFDREYVNAMVSGHQAVLDDLDTNLIPNAQNPELKDFLKKVRPSVEAHLQHAKSLQAKITAGKNAG